MGDRDHLILDNLVFVQVKFLPSRCMSDSVFPTIATDYQCREAGTEGGNFWIRQNIPPSIARHG